jgi:hypothetical protein
VVPVMTSLTSAAYVCLVKWTYNKSIGQIIGIGGAG